MVPGSGAGGKVRPMDKVVASAGEAIDGISDGASLAVGGFGLCGIPSVSDLEAGCRKGRWARPLTWGFVLA